MHILLKQLLKEVETPDAEQNPLKVQVYCDMDGVLVNLEKGFKAISGGLSPSEYEVKNGKNSFWKVINQKDPATGKRKYPTFWLDLEPMPKAKELWQFMETNFKDPKPVILTAGQGAEIGQQKEAWIRKHISSTAKVTLAAKGELKRDYIEQFPTDIHVSHVLVDDTEKNKPAWDDINAGRTMILYTEDNIESVKKQLLAFKNQAGEV